MPYKSSTILILILILGLVFFSGCAREAIIREPNSAPQAVTQSTITPTTKIVVPTITIADATDITPTSAVLNGNLISDGGASTNITIYWGISDRGTDIKLWDYYIPLKETGKGVFSSLVNNLTDGTIYYYRCHAYNTAGEAWTEPSSFLATTPTIPLIGITEYNGYVASGSNANDYLVLSSFTASKNGFITQFKLYCSASGNVKIGIYTDSFGQPDLLLNAINISQPVINGWNTIIFPPTLVILGEKYWLASNSDKSITETKVGGGNRRYKQMPFTSTFPKVVGTDFVSDTASDLISGWGDPIVPSQLIVPSTVNYKNIGNITSYGNGIYYFPVNRATFGVILSNFIREQHLEVVTITPDNSGYFVTTKIIIKY
jgi:hypothetical protein